MSTTNQQKSIKQVVKGEYKLVLLLTALFIFLPTIAAIISISDLIAFNSAPIMQKVAAVIGLGDSPFHDVSSILLIHGLLLIVLLPVCAATIARKLNGQRLLHSIRDGFKDAKQKRFWTYVLKVYLPYYVVLVISTIVLRQVVSSVQFLNAFAEVLMSVPLTIVVMLMIIIIASLIASISGIVFIANIVYMRADMRIKHSFQAITTRDINKYVSFNIITIVIFTVIFTIFFSKLMTLEIIELFQAIIGYIITVEVIILILQLLLTFIRIVLFVNIASRAEKVNVKSSVNKQEAIEQNKAIEVEETK